MGYELPHVQKVTVFMRLILLQSSTCTCVVCIKITMVTTHMHAPAYGKTSHNIANGRQTSNFPVTGILLIKLLSNNSCDKLWNINRNLLS